MIKMHKLPDCILTVGAFKPQPASNRYPLSPVQQEIFIGQQLDPQSPLYNMGMAFYVYGDIDVEKFASAWAKTVERADALKNRLYMYEGQVLQVSENIPAPIVFCDLSAQPDADQMTEAWMQADLKKPMDIYAQLSGSALIKISSKTCIWYCKLHHIITDASSYVSIWKQLNPL